MSNKKHIFISFASQEVELAKELQKIIQSAFPDKVSVFVSDTKITAGEIWEDEIKTAIKDATLVFVLCSPLSIKRPWVNFECGASTIPKDDSENQVLMIPLCHSGLRFSDLSDLTPFASWKKEDALDVHGEGFVDNMLDKIEKHFKEFKLKRQSIDYCLSYFRKDIKRSAQKKNGNEIPVYLEVTIKKEKIYHDDEYTLVIEKKTKTKPVGEDMPEDGWIKRVKKMNDFLTSSDSDPIEDVGLAIGIQNCLVDEGDIYVGVRMKSHKDFYSSSMSVAKGSFNTGYQLLQEGNEQNFMTMEALQDLFVTMPKHIKQTVRKDTEVYKKLKERVEANGSKLYSVRLPSGEEGVASVFINHSRRFPRFEIGIWKFVDLSSTHVKKDSEIITCKQALKDKDVGIIDGFGIDAFLDYLSADGVEETPINYWIWVKEGQIYYWSYPEERLIPRKKPGKPQKPMQAVLLTTKHMNKAYGNTVKYTPFTNDENLCKPGQVLAERFSLPAKVLLSCF